MITETQLLTLGSKSVHKRTQGTETKHCKKQDQNPDKFYAKPMEIIVWVSEISSE